MWIFAALTLVTIENLAATAAEFDQNSIDESKGSDRAILIGLINPVVGWPALEFVALANNFATIPKMSASLSKSLSENIRRDYKVFGA